MVRAASLLVFCLASLGAAQPITRLKPLCPETPVCVAGQAQAVIVAPQSLAEVAERLVEVLYQPIVDLKTDAITGAEALVRLRELDGSLMPPSEFIDIAEDTGLINELGEWVLLESLRQVADGRGAGIVDDGFTISVNVSVQRVNDGRMVTTVRDIVQKAGLPAERLVLEVTESTLITETDKIRATMQELRAFGPRLAVDDFGTRYSSLGYIQQFEFDVLKIDKSFVDGLGTGTNRQIGTAVLDLARELGVRTIAEGIETEVQDGVLRELGCRYGQGYLYDRPVPASLIEEHLRRAAVGSSTLAPVQRLGEARS